MLLIETAYLTGLKHMSQVGSARRAQRCCESAIRIDGVPCSKISTHVGRTRARIGLDDG